MFTMQQRGSRYKGYAPDGYEVSVDKRAWERAQKTLADEDQGLLFSPVWWVQQVNDPMSLLFGGYTHSIVRDYRPRYKVKHYFGKKITLGNSHIKVGSDGTVILRRLTYAERQNVDLIENIMADLRAGIDQWLDEAFDKLREVV